MMVWGCAAKAERQHSGTEGENARLLGLSGSEHVARKRREGSKALRCRNDLIMCPARHQKNVDNDFGCELEVPTSGFQVPTVLQCGSKICVCTRGTVRTSYSYYEGFRW